MSIFPTKVLLATDGSKDAERAADTAASLAQKTDSELYVVHGLFWASESVLDPEGLAPAIREEVRGRARRRLEELVGRIEASEGAVEDSFLRVGRADAAIVALAEEIGAGLIVMGSRGRGGVRRALMGSVSDSVVRHAHCPVMVVRGEPVSFPTKILLATDGSKEADLAATTAADLAEKTSSELRIVTVAEDPYLETDYTIHFPEAAERHRQEVREEVQAMLDAQVERVQEAGEKVAEAHLKVGRADDEIVSLAEEGGTGLIVMGSRGQGRIRRARMGSVSSSVVYHAHCPVLVVRE